MEINRNLMAYRRKTLASDAFTFIYFRNTACWRNEIRKKAASWSNWSKSRRVKMRYTLFSFFCKPIPIWICTRLFSISLSFVDNDTPMAFIERNRQIWQPSFWCNWPRVSSFLSFMFECYAKKYLLICMFIYVNLPRHTNWFVRFCSFHGCAKAFHFVFVTMIECNCTRGMWLAFNPTIDTIFCVRSLMKFRISIAARLFIWQWAKYRPRNIHRCSFSWIEWEPKWRQNQIQSSK